MAATSHIEKIRAAGIVGAGGAGFPTHVKLGAQAQVIIANGAECEPLLRVDQQIMEHYAAQVVKGVDIAMELAGAKRGVICLKEKYKQAVKSLKKVISDTKKDISLLTVSNYYPAGDEQALVYEVTGEVVPVGGIPIAKGAVVLNVNTLVNVAEAMDDNPVTHKYVTITGEVSKPVTVLAPIGTSVRKLVEYADGPANEEEYALLLGGPAMGAVTSDWDTPVTKTLGGIIVLKKDHGLITKKTSPLQSQIKLSRAACCGCNQCTLMCPRNTLGQQTSPHKAMRAIAFGSGDGMVPEQVISCCECGICSYFACTMELLPSRIMGMLKSELLKKKVPFENKESIGVSAERTVKNLPVSRLVSRLGIRAYDVPAPMEREPIKTERVKIPLKQHIGAPCTPCVKKGQSVKPGDIIGNIPEGQLGANVHASISGVVAAVDNGFVEIQAVGGNA
ncbi:MAG: SLBB domain-containing protein [Oscillospiraceae bacterium]|nr:SLBB domain-containing protein [Oscillospiraceae bacterium]MCL2277800.1 SLBB domain-containing protein [Oscillospiraceae bacterium]